MPHIVVVTKLKRNDLHLTEGTTRQYSRTERLLANGVCSEESATKLMNLNTAEYTRQPLIVNMSSRVYLSFVADAPRACATSSVHALYIISEV